MHANPPNKASKNIAPAVAAVLTENRQGFFRFLTSRLGNLDTAQEVIQEFNLRAISRASDLKDPDCAIPWLYRVLNSTVADFFVGKSPDVRVRPNMLICNPNLKRPSMWIPKPYVPASMRSFPRSNPSIPKFYRELIWEGNHVNMSPRTWESRAISPECVCIGRDRPSNGNSSNHAGPAVRTTALWTVNVRILIIS